MPGLGEGWPEETCRLLRWEPLTNMSGLEGRWGPRPWCCPWWAAVRVALSTMALYLTTSPRKVRLSAISPRSLGNVDQVSNNLKLVARTALVPGDDQSKFTNRLF